MSLIRRLYAMLRGCAVTCPPHWRIVSTVLVAAVGFTAGMWVSTPPPPWMEVNQLNAHYQVDALHVNLTGHYRVNRECIREQDLLWRIELIATDGQIAQFAPPEPRPSLRRGSHFYSGTVPLTQSILEDGWTVRLLITCTGEKPETVASSAARVLRIMDIWS